MSDGERSQARNSLAEETKRLSETVAALVRQQEEHVEWLQSLDQRLRAARESMLVLDKGS